MPLSDRPKGQIIGVTRPIRCFDADGLDDLEPDAAGTAADPKIAIIAEYLDRYALPRKVFDKIKLGNLMARIIETALRGLFTAKSSDGSLLSPAVFRCYFAAAGCRK